MKQDRWIYVVNYQQDGKWKQREFDTKESAETLLDRLRRNGVHYQFSRVRYETLIERMQNAELRWGKLKVKLLPVVCVLMGALTIGIIFLPRGLQP